MLVSIITPSFNQGRFIEKTIQSVLEQDYPNIEYIVVDGGSTDETIGIIKKYGDRIKWRSEPDEGQSDAINKGFRLAKGDIVAWLNSDDYYMPGAIKRVVEVFRNEPHAAMVYGDGWMVDETGEWQRPYNVESFFDLWKMIHLYNFVFQPSVFMRREALFSAGLLDLRYSYAMDPDLWVRISRTGKVVYVPEKLSSARVYPETKTQSGGWKRWREIVDISRKYGAYKWPPAVFLHVPKRFLKDRRGCYSSPVKSVVSAGRRWLYPLTMGGESGFYQDGYVSGRGHITLPLTKDAKTLVLQLEPVAAREIDLRIDGRTNEVLLKNNHPRAYEIDLAESAGDKDFLHLEFRSSSTKKIEANSRYPFQRKAGFRIKDIYYLTGEGKVLRELGFPNLSQSS